MPAAEVNESKMQLLCLDRRGQAEARLRHHSATSRASADAAVGRGLDLQFGLFTRPGLGLGSAMVLL